MSEDRCREALRTLETEEIQVQWYLCKGYTCRMIATEGVGFSERTAYRRSAAARRKLTKILGQPLEKDTLRACCSVLLAQIPDPTHENVERFLKAGPVPSTTAWESTERPGLGARRRDERLAGERTGREAAVQEQPTEGQSPHQEQRQGSQSMEFNPEIHIAPHIRVEARGVCDASSGPSTTAPAASDEMLSERRPKPRQRASPDRPRWVTLMISFALLLAAVDLLLIAARVYPLNLHWLGSTTRLPFTDCFDDGLRMEWQRHGNGWSIAEGVLQFAEGGETGTLTIAKPDSRNFAINVDVYGIQDGSGSAIVVVSSSRDCLLYYKQDYASGGFWLMTRGQHDPKEVDRHEYPPLADGPVPVRVEVVGNNCRVAQPDGNVLSIQVDRLTRGQVGLSGFGNVSYDNFLVARLP